MHSKYCTALIQDHTAKKQLQLLNSSPTDPKVQEVSSSLSERLGHTMKSYGNVLSDHLKSDINDHVLD